MDDDGRAIDALERQVAAGSVDAAARYDLAVLLLSEYEQRPQPALLGRAREQLTRAVLLQPAHAPSHAALGYTFDLEEDGAERALECFRKAHRLAPQIKTWEIFGLTLLAETGREDEAIAGMESAAPTHDVDLRTLREELMRAGFPTDARTLLANGFLHARNFFRSDLLDEAERILNRLDRGRKRRVAAGELAACRGMQRELERRFDRANVPAAIRPLARWARRYGVGDDVCRPLLLKRLSRTERATLIRKVDERSETIHAWLDTFGAGSMPIEAGAFLYLLSGVDEIRG